ncbi:hypothetical protein [Companilactobacillus zhongbaensis]|uniref:hypothetical protein n=1 Tax=Companilactobacillus zhongbaensis TaxID=2486009 RepID=UPI000F7ADC2F|nr:hypothetical protein [Companilactobacillus zhongbaensis]
MNLKIGGSNVGKIMYGGQEFGGSKMLESGTILLFLGANNKWTSRRLGLDFNKFINRNSITCKAFGVEKDWKNVSKIGVYVENNDPEIIDISDLKNGPCNISGGNITVKLEGTELTFISDTFSYSQILVEANNE